MKNPTMTRRKLLESRQGISGWGGDAGIDCRVYAPRNDGGRKDAGIDCRVYAPRNDGAGTAVGIKGIVFLNRHRRDGSQYPICRTENRPSVPPVPWRLVFFGGGNMALTVGLNSYISYNDAAAYFADRLYSDNWNNASHSDCASALIMATQRVEVLPLSGRKAVKGQTLHFPVVLEGHHVRAEQSPAPTVPKAVLNAVCEEALAILSGVDKRARLQAAGVESFNVGGLSETFNDMGFAYQGLQSIEARHLLQPWMGAIDIG